MKILVLGAAGMLGHKVLQTLSARTLLAAGTLRGARRDTPLDRLGMFRGLEIFENVDATDDTSMRRVFSSFRPTVVINCVGLVKHRSQGSSAVPSIAINALLPHRLALACADAGARLVHFSTDCVFSGGRGAYAEEDVSDATDLYGRTKSLGEVTGPGTLTLRTSMIGRELSHFHSLLEWFLSRSGGTVRGFVRAIYGGVTTNHLADLVSDIVEKHPELTGLYQVASDAISKYDLLVLLRSAFATDVEIIPDDSFVCDRSLRGDKLRAAIGYAAPPWNELVHALAEDPTPYEGPR